MKVPTLKNFLLGDEKAQAAFDKAVLAAIKADRRDIIASLKSLNEPFEDAAPVLKRAVKKAVTAATQMVRNPEARA